MRNYGEKHDELMNELEQALDDDSGERGERIRLIRIRIEDLGREQMGLGARLRANDRRSGPDALN